MLAPVGYVIQDVVADAMTVEAVPRVDDRGELLPPEMRRLMNTTLQTLGRVAIIGGGVLVSLVNVLMFQGVESLPNGGAGRRSTPRCMAWRWSSRQSPSPACCWRARSGGARRRRLRARGFDRNQTAGDPRAAAGSGRARLVDPRRQSGVRRHQRLAVGVSQIEFGQEIIFVGFPCRSSPS
jgi:hypothetical protein